MKRYITLFLALLAFAGACTGTYNHWNPIFNLKINAAVFLSDPTVGE